MRNGVFTRYGAGVTLHTQSVSDGHPARQIVNVVMYHPRRTHQSVPHVDMQPVSFALDGDYLHIDLPPVGTYTVIVIA